LRHLLENTLSPWFRWSDRNQYAGIDFPGIYVVAISRTNIAGEPFDFRKEIVYVGMTNAVAGLKGRLVQFDNTIAQRHRQHGGADRVLYKHQDYSALAKKLYVALRHFRCFPGNETSADLRVMGKVANAEYQCMARFVEEFGALPEFNRKKEAPKHSHTQGRGNRGK
jgi:hypothetical protein